jgi:hypothetical protein
MRWCVASGKTTSRTRSASRPMGKINGQHRLAAISCLEFSSEPDEGDAARVLVIFDVDPAQITFADTSKRSARDLTVMAAKRASA